MSKNNSGNNKQEPKQDPDPEQETQRVSFSRSEDGL